MGKTERKDGLYHVKHRVKGWTYAMWKGGHWILIGTSLLLSSGTIYWSEIGPRISEYKPKKRKK